MVSLQRCRVSNAFDNCFSISCWSCLISYDCGFSFGLGFPKCSEREVKSRSFIHFAFGPHPASVLLNDASHGGQANAGAFKVFRTMQALEDSEQFVHILHVEADAIVPD